MSYFCAVMALIAAHQSLQNGTSLAQICKRCSYVPFENECFAYLVGRLAGCWRSACPENRSQRIMKNYSSNRLTNGAQNRHAQGGERMGLALHEEPEEHYNELWKLMKTSGDHRSIRQQSLSSSYCSFAPSFPSSHMSADYLGNRSNTTTTIIGTSKPSQVPSLSNEDMLMSPCGSLQLPTPTAMVNSFNPLNMLNEMGLDALEVSYQINNTGHPVPSHAGHDQSHLSGFNPCISSTDVEAATEFPYISSTNVEASTALPSLSEPVIQHHHLHLYDQTYDHNNLPQCAYGNDQVLDPFHTYLQPYFYASGLGSSPSMSIPSLVACAETSKSAPPQSNDKNPQWGYTIYSGIHEGGRVNTDTFGKSGRAMHDFSTVLSTGPAAPGSLSDHNFGAKDKLEHSIVALMGETERRGLTTLTNPVIGAYHEAFTHNEMPNHDQGDKIACLSAGITKVNPSAAATNYGVRAYGSSDKADYRMQQVIKGSSGLSNMDQAQYEIHKDSGLQELQEAVEGDQNVSSGSTAQSIQAAEQHKDAERKRRRKQGDCYEALRKIIPINIPKKKKPDKVAVLESAIEYIEKLEGLVKEFQKEKDALGNNQIQHISS